MYYNINDSLKPSVDNRLDIAIDHHHAYQRMFDPRPHQMHMRMSLRARAEAYEVAMPLLGPPEKFQLLKINGTCTLTLVAPVSKNRQPCPSGTNSLIFWKSGTNPLANKFRRNKFADRYKVAVTLAPSPPILVMHTRLAIFDFFGPVRGGQRSNIDRFNPMLPGF